MADTDRTIEVIGDAIAEYVRSLGLDPATVRPYATADAVLTGLTTAGLAAALRTDNHPDRFRRCATCGQSGALVDLVYTFEVCSCPLADYPHLVEQIWHREHFAATTGDGIAAVVHERDRLVGDARRDALTGARRALAAEANRGEAGAHGRQQLTYAGGLRRAVAILTRLLDEPRTTKDGTDG